MARAEMPVNDRQSGLTGLVRDGLIRACGSLKAAAITMGIDQGQLTRDLQSGAFKFERLDRLADSEKAIVIERLHDEFASLLNPKAQMLRALDEIEARARAVRQFLEHVA